MTTPTIDALWKGYQIGQGSADHTAKEVFAEVIGPVLRDLVAAQEELKEAQEKLAAARAGIAQLKADLAARDAELAELMKWKEAVVNELIVAHIYSQAHDDSPRKAVHDAITWHCQVEIDPAVSSDARKLRDTYLQRAEAAERKAEEAARDSTRLDWMIEHGTDEGGGSGFEFRVYIPHDSECLRDAIDAAIAAKGGGNG